MGRGRLAVHGEPARGAEASAADSGPRDQERRRQEDSSAEAPSDMGYDSPICGPVMPSKSACDDWNPGPGRVKGRRRAPCSSPQSAMMQRGTRIRCTKPSAAPRRRRAATIEEESRGCCSRPVSPVWEGRSASPPPCRWALPALRWRSRPQRPAQRAPGPDGPCPDGPAQPRRAAAGARGRRPAGRRHRPDDRQSSRSRPRPIGPRSAARTRPATARSATRPATSSRTRVSRCSPSQSMTPRVARRGPSKILRFLTPLGFCSSGRALRRRPAAGDPRAAMRSASRTAASPRRR
jgi:hypothetical protein